MTSSSQPLTPPNAFSHLPAGLRDPLTTAFGEIVKNFREGRWEPSELNGGKLCEIVHTVLRGYVDGNYPAKPRKPRNMVDACKALEDADKKKFPRSVRIQIPRILVALYEIRNNRNVGHVGGDVDPNHMDAVAVLHMAKWIMAELVRLFHGVTTDEASAIVEGLTSREVPIIWEVAGIRRVLDSSLTMKDKMLLLLYTKSPLHEDDIIASLEYSNASVFRRDVLKKAHKANLIHYERKTGVVHLSPVGAAEVEKRLPLVIPT